MGILTTIANHKGGCGKTTTCLYLVGGLYQRGARTLLIDLDERLTLTKKMAAPGGATIADILRGRCNPQDAIQTAKFCDILPAAADLVTPEILIPDRPGKEYRLKKALEPIINNYDFILFDCPGSLNTLTINALTASDNCIIPTISDEDSIQGINSMLDICQDVKEYTNEKLTVSGILLTGLNINTVFGAAMLQNVENIAKRRGVHLFPTVRHTVEIQAGKFTAADVNILDALKKTPAKQEIENFVKEYLERI